MGVGEPGNPAQKAGSVKEELVGVDVLGDGAAGYLMKGLATVRLLGLNGTDTISETVTKIDIALV